MNIRIFSLALLLSACAPADETNNVVAEGSPPVDVPIQDGQQAPGTQPSQNQSGQAPAEPAGEVAFTASPDSVAQGGTLNLTLANRSGQPVGYNLCTSAIETAAGAPVQTDRVCTMELRTVEPGRSATYAYELPDDIEPGSYRLMTNIHFMDSGTQTAVRTGTFEVTGG
jgi:hypothetical protein